MECPICKKEFNENTGRRPKKFCSDECKVKFWNIQKKIQRNNKPEEKKDDERQKNETDQPSDNQSLNSTQETILAEIIKDEAELKTLPDTGLGIKRIKFLEKRIYLNKQKLKTNQQ